MTALPALHEDVYVEHFPDGAVAFDARSHRSVLLDEAAAALLLWLDGDTARAELERELSADGVRDPAAWVESAIADLDEAGLLAHPEG